MTPEQKKMRTEVYCGDNGDVIIRQKTPMGFSQSGRSTKWDVQTVVIERKDIAKIIKLSTANPA